MLQAILDGLIGKDVELLLLLTLNVDAASGAKNVDQAGPADCRGDNLGCESNVIEQVGKFPRGFGVAVLLVENKTFDGRD
jgi:hypothetical protein